MMRKNVKNLSTILKLNPLFFQVQVFHSSPFLTLEMHSETLGEKEISRSAVYECHMGLVFDGFLQWVLCVSNWVFRWIDMKMNEIMSSIFRWVLSFRTLYKEHFKDSFYLKLFCRVWVQHHSCRYICSYRRPSFHKISSFWSRILHILFREEI